MVSFFTKLKKEKRDESLIIDIGTEAVKAAVFQKNHEKNGEIKVSVSSVRYFDKFGILPSEIEIIKKAVSGAVEEIKKRYKLKTKSLILSLPSDILKARIINQTFSRTNSSKNIDSKEEGEINQEVLKEAKEIISLEFGGDAEEIRFLNFKVIERKIDGYEVSSLAGLGGSKIDFKMLFVFLPKKYLSWIEEINKSIGFKNAKIISESEGIYSLNKDISDAILFDVGGETSQIFLIKSGKLERIEELTAGVSSFSKTLSNILGITEEEAKFLKESYSKNELSEATAKQIKKILEPAAEEWGNNLRDKLKDWQILLPEKIFLFGGGSLLPEIKECFEKQSFLQEISVSGSPKINLMLPDYSKKVSFCDKKLNNPQFTPICFLTYEQS